MTLRSQIIGCGSYLPEHAVSNEELSRRVDTSDQWIRERSGIETRHIAAQGEFTSHLGIAAGQAALDDAGIEVGVLIAPVVPGLTSQPAKLERTIKAIADHGARFCGAVVMHLE